jgi:predicted neutral ceramidase superfamily lipid hydrolase
MTASYWSQATAGVKFVMDNWHLLWYVAIVMVAANYRILLTPALAPMSITMLGALAFVFVVFFFTSAAGGVEDESLVNRLPLHLVPALVFYLVLLWRARLRLTPPDTGNSTPPQTVGV